MRPARKDRRPAIIGGMTPTITLPADVLPVADGVLVIPHLLPLHIPHDALGLTVREWLNLTPA